MQKQTSSMGVGCWSGSGSGSHQPSKISSMRSLWIWLPPPSSLLLLWLWISSKLYLDFRLRIRAAMSYMLRVCLKTTFWRLNSIRTSFHKKSCEVMMRPEIPTHKTQFLRHCNPVCHSPGPQVEASPWPHREQWREHPGPNLPARAVLAGSTCTALNPKP